MKNIYMYSAMHPTMCAVYAAHRLYLAFLTIQLKYWNVLLSFRRLIMVLQIMGVEWNSGHFGHS